MTDSGDGLAERFTQWVEQYAVKICPPGCLPLPAQEKEISLFAEIVRALRASPPSGNAGEGIGDGTRLVGGIVAFEVVGDRLNSMAGFTRDEGVADIWRQGGLIVRPLFAAPPQPAPDALREVVDAEIARWENDDRTMYPDSDVLDSLDRIKAALTPLPSGEHPNADQPRK